ncbi:GNAT family N-acetyltransferase [Poritiphilus flavus]|uniref:GNAT family N-acetyltransferase n=1 Tax=Poritiphilus flavus TaxID=2697053 RepID=A0A6L9E892_9FLAO|nr:GNAT family N-acetyltransferase [Poritiphilus flavus]NAS10910.1 GNAT family N-acetyltransferase [Poritiphilus flavus]
MQLQLQKCTAKHLNQLIQLSKKTFVDAFEHVNDPEDFKTYIDKAFSKEQLGAELKNPDSSFYFAYLEQDVVGYFKLNEEQAQTDIKKAEALEVERIYVLQGFQGKRIGQWMMEEIKKIGISRKKSYLWLGVWEENVKAIDFYERHGFVKFGKHPYYIGKDRQMDWLMRFDLPSANKETSTI